MAGVRLLLPLTLGLVAISCSALLDFDELQGSPGSAGNPGSGGATAGAAGSSGGASGGSAGSAGSGGVSGIPLDEAAAAVADALCDKIELCAGTAAMEVLFGDEDCRVVGTSVIENSVIATIEEDALPYDPASAPACIAAFEELSCEQVNLTFPEECKRILGELKGVGEPCTQSLECDMDLYCSTGTCPGVCSEPLAQGSACTAQDLCAAGLTCFSTTPTSTDGTCEPLGGAASDCGGTVLPDCLTGFVCLGADEAALEPGQCFAAKDLFVLSATFECRLTDPPTLCREGLSCPVIAFPPRCTPEAEPGGACVLAVPDMCPKGQFCSNGICSNLPGGGQACAPGLVLKPRCQAYLRCVNEICRPLGDIDDPCALDAECYSGNCSGTRCAVPSCE